MSDVAAGGLRGLLRYGLAHGSGWRSWLRGDFLADVEAGEGAADKSDAEDQMFFVHLGKGAGKR